MKFGLIGAGCIGNIRADALKKIDGAQLMAVTDVDEGRAANLAAGHGARVFKTADDLIKSDEVEALIISTPPQFHEATVTTALRAGRHVICEKPLSNSLEACRRMVQVSKETGKTLATGFNHRYFPAIQYIKKALDEGAIGKLDHIRAFAGHNGLSQFRSPWEYDKNVIGGGALMDVGIHMLDLTAYLLGNVTEVYGVATDHVWKIPGSEDNGFALLRNNAGAVATFHATWTEWKGYRFFVEAYGDRGMLRGYYAPMMNLMIQMDKPGGQPRRHREFYFGNIIREKIHGWQSTVVETFRREFTDFMALCRGSQGTIIADGFAGFRAVEIANAIYTSTKEKKAVQLSASV